MYNIPAVNKDKANKDEVDSILYCANEKLDWLEERNPLYESVLMAAEVTIVDTWE